MSFAFETRVREAFDRASNLQGPQRRALLDSIRASDPALAEEVESLLRFADRESLMLDRAVVPPGDAPNWPRGPGGAMPGFGGHERAGVSALPSTVGAAGRRVGAELRAGSTFLTYAALDSADATAAVIKLVRPELVTPAMRERFAAARAEDWPSHAGLARLLDVGVAGQGDHPFVVFERVEGPDLLRACVEPGASPHDRLRWAGQLCRAIAAGHDAGRSHGSLRPDKVRVVESGGSGRSVKVLGFGLSGLIDDPPAPIVARASGRPSAIIVAPGASGITRVRAGSPYAAPELAPGAGVADARADVFALGIIVHEAVTGRLPGQRLASRGDAAASVAGVLARAVRTDPAERWSDAGQMADALEACPAHERRPGWLARVLRPLRR